MVPHRHRLISHRMQSPSVRPIASVRIMFHKSMPLDHKIPSESIRPTFSRTFKRTEEKCGSMLGCCPVELVAKIYYGVYDRNWYSDEGKYINYMFSKPRLAGNYYNKYGKGVDKKVSEYFGVYRKICAACQKRASDKCACRK